MKRKFLSSAVSTSADLGPRQIRVRASSGALDRDGDVLMPGGCVVRSKTIPVLADHTARLESVLGTAAITVSDASVDATITFLDEGVSKIADLACALYKAGAVDDVSVGFEPGDFDRTKTGYLFKTWELLELSCVVVGSNPEAVVTAKALNKSTESEWKVGASTSLPTSDDESWDGPAAAKAILDAAGFDGDDPDSVKARSGFLAYDSANPDLRGSYKLPFATIIDGKLTVTKGGVRAAASRLPQADIPEDVKDKARKVLDHYEEALGMGDNTDKNREGKLRKAIAALTTKGMWQVGQLANLLADLGWQKEMAEWESAAEGDNSKVPAMLADALKVLADAFMAMTAEEVSELLGSEDVDIASEELDDSDGGYVLAGASVAARKFRLARVKARRTKAMETAILSRADIEDAVIVLFGKRFEDASGEELLAAFRTVSRVKSGRKISAATADTLQQAMDAHQEAMGHQKAAIKAHNKGVELIKGLMEPGADGDPDEDGDVTTSQSTGTVGTDGNTSEKMMEHMRCKARLAQLTEQDS